MRRSLSATWAAATLILEQMAVNSVSPYECHLRLLRYDAMASKGDMQRRLADMVNTPRESLDVELKSWLDLAMEPDRATLAKAIIALANHGGGHLLFGFDNKTGLEASGRPDNLSRAYSTDAVNSAVEKYAEPGFHCDVHLVDASGSGRSFPVVAVPPGRVPIRAKRSGPNGEHIQQNFYYVRRAGPKSEPPLHGHEWEHLIGRCVRSAREELLDHFRVIMHPTLRSEPVEEDRLTTWIKRSMARWRECIADVPRHGAARFPLGYRSVAFQIRGDFQPPTGERLLQLLHAAPQLTGWPPFWVPTQDGMRPYPFDNCTECWLGSASPDNPTHADYWRVSKRAEFFLIRGYDEDSPELKAHHRVEPGKVFDITLPVWRTGEVLVRAAWLAEQLGGDGAEIVFHAEWTGLSGRSLVSIESTRLIPPHLPVAKQGALERSLTATAKEIRDGLPEILQGLLAPLYELFDFMTLPSTLVVEELQKLRSRRF